MLSMHLILHWGFDWQMNEKSKNCEATGAFGEPQSNFFWSAGVLGSACVCVCGLCLCCVKEGWSVVCLFVFLTLTPPHELRALTPQHHICSLWNDYFRPTKKKQIL